MTTRAERFVRGKGIPFLLGLLVLIVLAMGAVAAADWWLAHVLPWWLFATAAMVLFAAQAAWRGWRKAARK